MGDGLTIGALAARSGVATSALRYYEARGLVSADRSASGHRRYSRDVLRRIAFIVFAQRVGWSLDEIGEALRALPRNAVPRRADWARLSRRWSAHIDDRIAELQALRESLTGCIGCGCLSLERCRLANPGDGAARFGPGPLVWNAAMGRRRAP
jgi:MerR family redox-sensitive transcriptional activator SoxR